MSTVAVRAQGNALSDKMAYAQAMASSTLLPKQYQRQPGNLLFALEYADALGVSPIHAITSIHVIEGKPTASADLIAALIRKAGHRLRITGDDTQCVAILIRQDDPDFEFRAEWTMKKAQSAGLTGKGVWKNYPGAMLRSRAITEVARMGAPDALYGVIYTPEELGADVNAEGEPVEFVEQPAPEPERPKVTRQRKPVEVAPDPEPEPEIIDAEPLPEAPDGITTAQLTKLNIILQEQGLTERDDKLAYLSSYLERPIASSKDLTKAEAHRLIDEHEPAVS
jgi:hypothetical protein